MLALVAGLLALSVAAAQGQGNSSPSKAGNPATATEGQGNPPPSAQGNASTGQAGKPERPEKRDTAVQPAGNGSSAEVRQMLKDFREQQKARLDEYRRVAAQARDAGAEKREQLREQLRRMLEEQKEERALLREQIRERVQDLTKALPSRKDVIAAAKEKAREKQDRARGE